MKEYRLPQDLVMRGVPLGGSKPLAPLQVAGSALTVTINRTRCTKHTLRARINGHDRFCVAGCILHNLGFVIDREARSWDEGVEWSLQKPLKDPVAVRARKRLTDAVDGLRVTQTKTRMLLDLLSDVNDMSHQDLVDQCDAVFEDGLGPRGLNHRREILLRRIAFHLGVHLRFVNKPNKNSGAWCPAAEGIYDD